MKLSLDDGGEDSPDLLVNASIFAGLLAYFAALVAVFTIFAKPAVNSSLALADETATEQRYFGSSTEFALLYPDRVEFFVNESSSFAVASEDVPRNPAILEYFAQLAASEHQDSKVKRKLLLAIQPGSASNMFWLETMAGDSGIESLSFLWFNSDCAHIENRGSEGARLMAECLEVRG